MGWRDWRLAVLAALKMRLNLNCPLAFVLGYLVFNWMETEDPSTDTTSMDGPRGSLREGWREKWETRMIHDDTNKKVTGHDCCFLDTVLSAYCSELWQEHLTQS